jgi:hypothetical protein
MEGRILQPHNRIGGGHAKMIVAMEVISKVVMEVINKEMRSWPL